MDHTFPMSVLEELLEDLQSSRRKFELEHSEGDQYRSQSQSDGRIIRAECHLHRGDDSRNRGK